MVIDIDGELSHTLLYKSHYSELSPFNPNTISNLLYSCFSIAHRKQKIASLACTLYLDELTTSPLLPLSSASLPFLPLPPLPSSPLPSFSLFSPPLSSFPLSISFSSLSSPPNSSSFSLSFNHFNLNHSQLSTGLYE